MTSLLQLNEQFEALKQMLERDEFHYEDWMWLAQQYQDNHFKNKAKVIRKLCAKIQKERNG